MIYTIKSLECNGSIIGQCTFEDLIRLYNEYDISIKCKNENGGMDLWVVKKKKES